MCEFDDINRLSSTLQNSNGKWKVKYEVSKSQDKFWNVCDRAKGAKFVQDQFDEIVARYEQQDVNVSSKYVVRREGQVLFDLIAARDELVKEISEEFNLNETQELVFATYCAHLDSSDLVRKTGDKFRKFVLRESFRANLSGGTGKSRDVNVINEYSRRIGRPEMVLCAAQFGSVASAMQGWTIASLLGQKYNGEEYDPSKNKELIENCKLLIIDEISLIDKRTWIKLNNLFKSVKGNNKFFGGVHLLLVGDCFQLPPVSWSGDGMIHVDSQKCKREVSQVTREYLKQVEYAFILTEQWRMKDDGDLAELARGFRRGRFEKRHEEFLQSRYKNLEQVDLGKSIVLVGSRKEKASWLRACQETKIQAYGGNCIGWFANCSKPMSFSSLEEKVTFMRNLNDICILNNEPVLPFSVFVKDELVTCKFNHSVLGGVTNGTFGKLKDLHFPHETRFTRVKVGDTFITLADKPPMYALMETIAPGKKLAFYGEKQLPVFRYSSSVSELGSITNLPLESACVSTVHGIQGKTIPKEYSIVVIDLKAVWTSFPPAEYYVAFTRAKHAYQLIV